MSSKLSQVVLIVAKYEKHCVVSCLGLYLQSLLLLLSPPSKTCSLYPNSRKKILTLTLHLHKLLAIYILKNSGGYTYLFI